MATIFDLYSRLKLDTTTFESGLETSRKKMSQFFVTSEKTLKQVGRQWKTLGADMLKLAAGPALAGGVALRAYAEQEKAVAQLEAVLKSTGGAAGYTSGQLQAMASALQEQTTFGDEATLAGQSLLLTFMNIKATLPDATLTMLDMSAALGQDLKSSAIQLGKALNDPVRGVTALQRVGVSFAEQQKKQIKAMAEAGDVMGAQKLILAELAKEFGGSAAAQAATFGGQMIQLKNAAGDLMELIGGALAPAVGWLGVELKAIIPPMQNWITQHPTLSRVLGGTGVALTALVGGLGIFALTVGQASYGLASLITVSKTAIPGLAKLAAAGWAAAAPMLPLALAVGGVGLALTLGGDALGFWNTGLLDTIRNTRAVRTVTDGMYLAVVNAWAGIKTFLMDTMDALISRMRLFIEQSKEVASFGLADTLGKQQAIAQGYQARKTARAEERDRTVSAAYEGSVFGSEGAPAPAAAATTQPAGGEGAVDELKAMRQLMEQLVRQQRGLGTARPMVPSY